jgi:hypothetical protein
VATDLQVLSLVDAALDADHLIRGGREIPAFIGEYSATRTLLSAILCAVFALIGLILVVLSDDGRIIGAISLLFFGAGAIALGLSVRRPGRIALSPEGILVESRFAEAFAPWDAVTGVGRARISRADMLTIDVSDASRLQTSRGTGWLKRLNQSVGMPDLAVPTSLLGSRAELVQGAIEYYLANPDARQRIGSVEELEGLRAAIGLDTDGAEEEPELPHPRLSRWILWLAGGGGLALVLAASLGDPNPGREGSRIAGLILFGIASGSAVGSASLMTRRPRLAQALGLVAAAGALFIGWAVMRAASTFPGALIALAIAACGVIVAWQLIRWSPRKVTPT